MCLGAGLLIPAEKAAKYQMAYPIACGYAEDEPRAPNSQELMVQETITSPLSLIWEADWWVRDSDTSRTCIRGQWSKSSLICLQSLRQGDYILLSTMTHQESKT